MHKRRALLVALSLGLYTQWATAAPQVPERLQKVDKLTYCSGMDSPPLVSFDESQKPRGLTVDLGLEIAKRLGDKQVQWRVIPFSGLVPALLAQQCDMIVDQLFDKPERRQVIDIVNYMYSSQSVVVPKGNPKGILDWDDLIKPGVAVITPNPKTSGGARWNYLAAWEFAKRKFGSDAKAKEFVGNLYKNVPVLDTGARGATITFVQRNVGDVLLAWENEAFLALKEFGADRFQLVVPSISILAEPSVTLVDKNVDKKGTRAVAMDYLAHLYSDEGQDIAGRHHYRPTGDKAKAKYASQFLRLTLFTIDQGFGGWAKADKAHFADGANFDQIYSSK